MTGIVSGGSNTWLKKKGSGYRGHTYWVIVLFPEFSLYMFINFYIYLLIYLFTINTIYLFSSLTIYTSLSFNHSVSRSFSQSVKAVNQWINFSITRYSYPSLSNSLSLPLYPSQHPHQSVQLPSSPSLSQHPQRHSLDMKNSSERMIQRAL